MERVRFKAKQVPSGVSGRLQLDVIDNLSEVSSYLREQREHEKKKRQGDPAYELYLDCELKRYHKRRSVNANNLQWELCTRLGAADHVSKDVVHNAVKETFYPRIEYRGTYCPKDGDQLTTVEFARIIEVLVEWCVDRADPVDIHDIWILFTDWRYGQERDPLEGTYGSQEDYKEKHPLCEACGKFLLWTGEGGTRRHAGQLAHIVPEGAAGRDDRDTNWLVLCTDCHIFTQHSEGWAELLHRYPHVTDKVQRAMLSFGRAPVAGADGAPLSRAPDPKALPEEPQSEDAAKAAFLGRVKALEEHAKAQHEKNYPKPAPQPIGKYDDAPAPVYQPKPGELDIF